MNWHPLPFNGKAKIAARPGTPEPGLVLRTQRGSGVRTHALLVFALDDLWAYAFGVRSLCFASGGPWWIESGKPTCRRCLQICGKQFGDHFPELSAL